MLKNQIAAIVVTYDRLTLLQRVVNGLLNQTYKIDKIIIVNNSSSDGTKEWLSKLMKENSYILVLEQENLGSSGGQYTGGKAAYDMGYEWIWQMDDDVIPRPDCLEKLLKFATNSLVCSPIKITNENKLYFGVDIFKLNMTNPFKSIWRQLLSKNIYEQNKTFIPIEGFTLEGPLFHREMLEKVGFVEKNFFIYADDTEYSIRLLKCGIKLGIVKDAIIDRLLPSPVLENNNLFDWKTYYIIRNLIAIDVLHGNALTRIVRPWGYFLTWLCRCKNVNNIKTTIKAFINGYFYKSNN